MFGGMNEQEREDLMERARLIQHMFRDQDEDTATAMKSAADRGRDARGRKINKPFAPGANHVRIQRDHHGKVVNKPFAPRNRRS